MSENEIHADDSLSNTQVEEETPETAQERDQRIRKAQRRRRLFTILPPILLVLGILVLLYPVIATYQNNVEQQRIAKAFSAEQTNVGRDVIKDELARADEYNRQAAEAPILDPWLESQRPNTPQYTDYLSQLNVNPVMATVKVPSADISLPITAPKPQLLKKALDTSLELRSPSVAKELTQFLPATRDWVVQPCSTTSTASNSAMSSTSKSLGVT